MINHSRKKAITLKNLGLYAVLFMVLAMVSLHSGTLKAQIYAPEGLNMPGDWDGWMNPPENTVFAGTAQSAAGEVRLIPLGNPVYQTTFHVSATGGHIVAGDYAFKFTSGPLESIWQNQWGNVAVQMNSIQEYTYGVAGTGEPEPNNISVTNNHWYVSNWDNIGYGNTRAIFMELSAEPVEITAVTMNPMMPAATDAVEIAFQTTVTPSPEEHFFVRYSTDNWSSATLLSCVVNGTAATATIPALPDDTEVNYYVFSSGIANPAADFDLITLRYNNNGGANYSYTVGDTLSCGSGLALVGTEPPFPVEGQAVTLTFNASLGNGGLAGYNADVYVHTGVITNLSTGSSDWKYVKTTWGENTPETKLTLIDSNLYELTIPDIRAYYDVPAGEEILMMALVFRSAEPMENGAYLEGKTAENGDIFVEVYADELNVKITYPTSREPLVDPSVLLPVCVAAMQNDSVALYLDQLHLASSDETTLFHALNSTGLAPGTHWLIAKAYRQVLEVVDSVLIFVRDEVPVAALPEGMKPGVNYLDGQRVTLVLNDPARLKKYAFVVGDFNNWSVTESGYMNRTPDGEYFWITLTGLTAGTEYAYQYYVDGTLKLADPYTDKVLDPWNDKWIPETTYPNLKAYPFDLTTGIVSVMQPGRTPYDWKIADFTPVAVHETQSDLIVYELLVRDFVADRRIVSVMDSLDYLKNLGVNAIELMPVNEFEGNDSWGYNPSFYFAPDKAYGTMNDYKAFIDACHERDIAVILDVVLNHSFGQSPLVQMYWDSQLKQPTAQNPWYNQQATHPLSPGYDFNHESEATRTLMKRFFNYWLEEFKVDGFRLDLSKGFTQTWTGSDVGAWSQYDQSRVNILNDYYQSVKATNPDAYMILEHLGDNSEEVVLANTGMLLWGKMTDAFNQCTMGWSDNSDYSWAYYSDRGYTYPNLIPFMESHDEERLPVKNLLWGNGSGSYQVKDTLTSLARMQAATVMYLAVPGPKMIWQFGELGYDYSINYCPDGSISEDCRTSAKPIRWDYWNQTARQELYQVFAGMARLKTDNIAFEQGTFGKDLGSMGKRAWVTHESLNVCMGANFDVVSQTLKPGFQHTGTWYNYFTGEAVEVTDAAGHSLALEAGGYYVFTDQQLGRPFVNLTFQVNDARNGSPLEGAVVELGAYGQQTTDALGQARFALMSDLALTFNVSHTQYTDTTGSVNLSQADVLKVIELRGVDGLAEHPGQHVQLYPNPAGETVTLSHVAGMEVSLYTLNGKLLQKHQSADPTLVLKLNGLPAGVYIVKLKNMATVVTKRLVHN